MRVVRLFDGDRHGDRAWADAEPGGLDQMGRRLRRMDWPSAPPGLRERCWERFSGRLAGGGRRSPDDEPGGG
jgi:hypothetical protein